MFDRQSGSTYPGYFGMREQPFNLAPDPRFIYRNASHTEAHAELLAAVRDRKGFVVLTGAKGIGKTTLLRKVMEDLAQSARCYFFSEPALTVDQLHEFGRGVLGLKPEEDGERGDLGTLDRYLRAQSDAGRTTVFLIDEAHGITAEALEALDRLVDGNHHGDGESHLQVVLAGLPDLVARLLGAESWRLKKSAVRQVRLQPIAANEVGAYLDHRLAVAGNENKDLFTAEAARMIAADAGGIPRRINLLADKALTAAERSGRTQVSPELLATIGPGYGAATRADPAPPGKAPPTGTRPVLRAAAGDLGGRGARRGKARGGRFGADRERPVTDRPPRAAWAWAAGGGAIVVLVAMVALSIGQAGGDRTADVAARTRIAELSFQLRAAEDKARELDIRLDARGKARLGLISRLAQSKTEIGRLRRDLAIAERRRRPAADESVPAAEPAQRNDRHRRMEAELAEAARAATGLRTEIAEIRAALRDTEAALRRSRAMAAADRAVKLQPTTVAAALPPKVAAAPASPARTAATNPPRPTTRAKVTAARSNHARRLAALMRRAEVHVAARRLTTPAKVNALATYRRVLRLAPGHQPALEGIDALKAQYLEWAAAALRKRHWINTRFYYEKALAIDPDDTDLAGKLRQIKQHVRRSAKASPRRARTRG